MYQPWVKVASQEIVRVTLLLVSIIIGAHVTTILAAQSDALVVRNEFLVVAFEPGTTIFTLTTTAGNHPFVTQGTLSQNDGAGRVIEVNDPIWGQGRAVEVTYPSGTLDRLSLFPDHRTKRRLRV